MSLHWTIDSKLRRVTLVVEGSVSSNDVDVCRQAVVGAKARPYAKMVDGRAGEMPKDMAEVVDLGADIRGHHDNTVGALAIVLTREQRESPLLARFFGILATARRPMRVFSDPAAARRWLDDLPPAD